MRFNRESCFFLIALALSASSTTSVCAQVFVDPYTAVVGPAYGYTAYGQRAVFASIVGNPGTQQLTPGIIDPGNDDGVATVPLPFNFRFFDNNYVTGRNVYMSVNGYVNWDHYSTSPQPTDFLTDAVSFGNQPAIAPLFQDLTILNGTANGPGLYSLITGTAGNQVWTLEWHQVQDINHSDQTNPVSFQMVLFEGSNRIRFNYLSTIFGNNSNNGGSATVGIRDTNYNYPPEDVLQWGYRGGPANGGDGVSLGNDDFRIDFAFSSVPEPGTIALIGCATAATLGGLWWRRRKAVQT